MTTNPSEETEDFPIYEPSDDPANFEPKPIYSTFNENFEEVDDDGE